MEWKKQANNHQVACRSASIPRREIVTQAWFASPHGASSFPPKSTRNAAARAYGAERIEDLNQADNASPSDQVQLARRYVVQTQPQKRIRRTTPANSTRTNDERPGLVQRPASPGRRQKRIHLIPTGSATPVDGTPDMGVNLWGASPLYENGNGSEDSIPNVNRPSKSTRRRQLRGGDEPWGGSLRMCWLSGQRFLVATFTPKLRGYEQKRHTGRERS